MIVLLHLAFFASGLAALLFETLWFRQAGLAFGNSVWASSLVLAGFMGGSALGNLAAARAGDRPPLPLRAYAALEAAIGVSGLALVYVLPAIGSALAPMFGPLLDHPLLLNPFRLAVAFVLLLIPSSAMGMTLPVLTRALTAYDANFGAVLGRLYAWNTLGAVAGVLTGEFVFVEHLGVHGTGLCATALSLTVAIAVAGLRPTPPAAAPPVPPGLRPRRASARVVAGAPPRWPWLAAASVSGFCLLALEVVWFRALLLVVHGHSEAFAVMLATVLAGIAMGGLVGAAWLRRRTNAWSAGAAVAFGAGALVGVCYRGLLAAAARFGGALITTPWDILTVAAVLMLPVAVLSGVFFTFAAAALRANHASATQTTGWITFANTAGAAVGSLAGGFLLLPILGVERSLFALAVVYGVTGGLLLFTGAGSRRVGYGFALAFGGALLLFPFGEMRDGLLRLPLKRLVDQWVPRAPLGSSAPEIAAVREGLTETITFYRVPFLGRPLFHVLWNNAVPMADTEWQSRRYMKAYVYWPTAVHPHLRRALLIGYGVGNTARALADSDALETIDVVDISREVLDMSGFVHPADDPLRDPRVRVHVEDGRFFLQTRADRFDLITSEPPPPASAGVVNLYTSEYFALLRSHLAPGGIVAYWLPLHALSDDSTRSIVSAFCGVFRDCSLWHGIGSELMLAGTREATGPVSEEQFTTQWRTPRVAAEMARLGFERPEQLGALFIGDADFLEQVAAGAAPVVDDFPRRIARRSPADDDALVNGLFDTTASRERFLKSPLVARLWPPPLITASLPYFDVQARINAHALGRGSIADVHRLLVTTDLRMPVEWLLGTNADADRVVSELTAEEQSAPVAQYHLGIRLLAQRQYAAAAESFARAGGPQMPGAQVFGLRVLALAMAGRVSEGQQAVHDRVAQLGGQSPQFLAENASPFWRFMRETFGIERR